MRVKLYLFFILVFCVFSSCTQTQEPSHAQLYDFVKEYLNVSSLELAKYAIPGTPGYKFKTDEMKKYYRENGNVDLLPHSGKSGILFIIDNSPKNIKIERKIYTENEYNKDGHIITYFVKLRIKKIGFGEDGFIKEFNKESMESLGYKIFNKEFEPIFIVEYDTKTQRIYIDGDNLLHDIYIFEKHKGILKERLGLQE